MLRHRAWGAVAAAAMVSTLVVAAPANTPPATGSHRVAVVSSSGVLSDLSPSTADPTDGASATALVVSHLDRGSLVVLRVAGLDSLAAGTTYGAHVHVGPCVAGDGAAAGPHYNTTGGTVIDPSTEVWLDFTVRSSGSALAVALVPFVVPAGGARSIVIHAMSTMPNGTAGARLACLPLEL
jgi:Cu/Zn superoxide dismutase